MNACDRGVAALRRWLRKYAPTLVTKGRQDGAAALLQPSPLNRNELFDREAQHTAHCVHCSRAQRSLATWRRRTPPLLALLTLLGIRWWIAKGAAAACLAALPLLVSAERALAVGGFEHHRNA